jgi:hypothetical protein
MGVNAAMKKCPRNFKSIPEVSPLTLDQRLGKHQLAPRHFAPLRGFADIRLVTLNWSVFSDKFTVLIVLVNKNTQRPLVYLVLKEFNFRPLPLPGPGIPFL